MTAPRYKWQPSTAEIAKAAGIAVEDVVRFDHNTSPFATEWAVPVVTAAATALNEYPGADYRPLREAGAGYAGLAPDQVAVGAGVDELLLLIGRAFLRPGATSVMVTPTYPLYRISSFQAGASVIEVPAHGPDFDFPRRAVVDAAAGADVTWLCVPDNPTGGRMADEAVAAVLDASSGIVVVDAAYAEFAGDLWSDWVERHPRLLVLHTLSKGFGLAGIRVGLGFGDPALIDALDAIRPPGSISNLSLALGSAAVAAPDRMRRNVAAICEARSVLAADLTHLGFDVLDSQTNFLLCDVEESSRALGGSHALGRSLVDIGLVPRTYPEDGPLGSYLRFTVRSPQENRRLVDALERTLA